MKRCTDNKPNGMDGGNHERNKIFVCDERNKMMEIMRLILNCVSEIGGVVSHLEIILIDLNVF